MLLGELHIIMPCVCRAHLYLKKTFKEKKEKHGFQSKGKARGVSEIRQHWPCVSLAALWSLSCPCSAQCSGRLRLHLLRSFTLSSRCLPGISKFCFVMRLCKQ